MLGGGGDLCFIRKDSQNGFCFLVNIASDQAPYSGEALNTSRFFPHPLKVSLPLTSASVSESKLLMLAS